MAVSAARMKELERIADAAGLSYYQMMENAGTQAYHIIKDRYPSCRELIIFIGKGNNGGDGLVIARLAAAEGKDVAVVRVEGEPSTPDAIRNYKLLHNHNVDIYNLEHVAEWPGTGQGEPSGYIVAVDAIYGTGFHGTLRASGRLACDFINSLKCPVIALDIPSGLNCDTGEAAEGAVKAALTITFHEKKFAHEMPKAEKYCGEVITADIGICAE